MKSGGLWLAALLSASGCASVGALDRRSQVATDLGAVTLRYGTGDERSAEQVKRATEHAEAALKRWGHLQGPVEFKVLGSHEALEAATGRRYAWLRAWARYSEVLIQSPRTWGLLRADDAAVEELVVHELTHCLMYQLAADEASWPHKGIPLWFREGMASVTAHQGYRRAPRAEISRFYREHLDDPLRDADDLYAQHPDVVYGAAHLAFERLEAQFGADAVRALLARMRQGCLFDEAFQLTFGESRSTFERDFRGWALAP